ncbi:hypothetical protein CCUS01_13058 [Colletotrichum cuscutae]|uniref:Uncharacterized protein n=1 Tax=Colletotrichum cuscutae TaxID=1209917 RepID=A0AAJ0DQ62_9PEZI|nr:hypothetical protein CCUS01_13058 [Colletotrichum cuscutae]
MNHPNKRNSKGRPGRRMSRWVGRYQAGATSDAYIIDHYRRKLITPNGEELANSSLGEVGSAAQKAVVTEADEISSHWSAAKGASWFKQKAESRRGSARRGKKRDGEEVLRSVQEPIVHLTNTWETKWSADAVIDGKVLHKQVLAASQGTSGQVEMACSLSLFLVGKYTERNNLGWKCKEVPRVKVVGRYVSLAIAGREHYFAAHLQFTIKTQMRNFPLNETISDYTQRPKGKPHTPPNGGKLGQRHGGKDRPTWLNKEAGRRLALVAEPERNLGLFTLPAVSVFLGDQTAYLGFQPSTGVVVLGSQAREYGEPTTFEAPGLLRFMFDLGGG